MGLKFPFLAEDCRLMQLTPRLPATALTLASTLALTLTATPAPAQTSVTVTQSTASGVAEELRYTGTITAEREAALSPRVSGLVSAVRADVGDHVKKGDLLLELDDSLARLALNQAKAALEEAEIRREEQERVRDDAQSLVETSTIARTQARAAAAEAAMAGAAASRLSAELARQQELVARHRLLAPFDGVVRRRMAEVGEWVDNATPVLELVTMQPVRLDIQVPQERYDAVRSGQAVRVRLDALPGLEFAGKVIARVPASDPASRTVLVRARLDDPEGRIIPGMSGLAHFDLPARAGAVTVPRDAVIRGSDGLTRVWVVDTVDGIGRAGARRVTLGRTQAGRVEILDGLEAGRSVVVQGNENLREGQEVRVVESQERP